MKNRKNSSEFFCGFKRCRATSWGLIQLSRGDGEVFGIFTQNMRDILWMFYKKWSNFHLCEYKISWKVQIKKFLFDRLRGDARMCCLANASIDWHQKTRGETFTVRKINRRKIKSGWKRLQTHFHTSQHEWGNPTWNRHICHTMWDAPSTLICNRETGEQGHYGHHF